MCFSGIQLLTILLAFIAIALAYPYSWGMHQNNYDASLDPIAWSRGFVKDSIRRPRLLRSNSVDNDEEDNGRRYLTKKNHFAASQYRFGRRNSASKASHADFMNSRYAAELSPGKFSSMRKNFYRRRLQKLDARERYGLI
uniref:Uncharacterized protein n=1 Tax=Stomoxys calcitrans TaxID=35570 RepID=A0A1I8NWU8_STOCA|nr:unnamed protein product [Stomoxys calcitrans]